MDNPVSAAEKFLAVLLSGDLRLVLNVPAPATAS